MPLTTKEMLQSGGSDNMFTRNLEKTIAGDGMQEIGGEKEVKKITGVFSFWSIVRSFSSESSRTK